MHDEHAQLRGAWGACSTSSVRQSRKTAWSARPSTDAIWSWMPHGTPVATCSARCAASASSVPREREAGRVAERERARDLERRARRQARRRPAPSRRSSRSTPTGARPELGEHADDAATARPHAGSGRGRIVAAVGGDVDLAVEVGRARDRRGRRRAAVRAHHDVAVDRQRDDPAFVVVDLAADQVHAARARGTCATRVHASRSACAAASGTTGFDSVPLPTSPDATKRGDAGRAQRGRDVRVQVPFVAAGRGRLVEPQEVREPVAPDRAPATAGRSGRARRRAARRGRRGARRRARAAIRRCARGAMRIPYA